MELNSAGERKYPYASVEQLRYARVLDAGMRVGLLVLVLGLLAYVSGLLPSQVALTDMPSLWSLPAPEFLRASGMPDGWGWVTMLDKGDALSLVGIAILSSVSVLCFALLLPSYLRQRDWAYFAMGALEIVVLVLAASGVLTGAH